MGVLLIPLLASVGTEKLIGICLREHKYGIQIPQGAWHTFFEHGWRGSYGWIA